MIHFIAREHAETIEDIRTITDEIMDNNPASADFIAKYLLQHTATHNLDNYIGMGVFKSREEFVSSKDIVNRIFAQTRSEDKTIEDAAKAAVARLNQYVFLTAEELEKGKQLFNAHYYTGATPPGGGLNEVYINWKDIKDDFPEDDTSAFYAYKFIHCIYKTKWVLTAQKYHMSGAGRSKLTPPVPHNLLYTPGMSPTPVKFCITKDGRVPKDELNFDLVQPNKKVENYYHQDYMDYLKTHPHYGEEDRVWSVTIPVWELQKVITHNLLHTTKFDDYRLNFVSVSYDLTWSPELSSVNFPHSVAIYASKGPDVFLGIGNAVVNGVFTGNAANMDTLAPPNHNTYFWPNDLPF
jgi:hypothetical protein